VNSFKKNGAQEGQQEPNYKSGDKWGTKKIVSSEMPGG
jgi:hypothetical protein